MTGEKERKGRKYVVVVGVCDGGLQLEFTHSFAYVCKMKRTSK